MADTVSFKMPGLAWHVVDEGNWPSDCPEGWAEVNAAPRQRSGGGFFLTVTMTREHAADLAHYLVSVVEVEASMSADERAGSGSGSAAARTVTRIRAALGWVEP